MMKDSEDIRHYSLDELKQRRAKGKSSTRPDAAAQKLDADFWASARVVMPPAGPKAAINLRIDQDVLDWFRAQGKGHLSRMNAVLRSFMEAHE